MELMSQYPDKHFDLAIVDPPYGIGESKKTQSRPLFAKQKNGTKLQVKGARKHAIKDWDLSRPETEYFKQLQRCSKNQIIFGGNHFADLLPASSGWVVWDKLNEGSDQSDCELAWTSFKKGVRKYEFLWNGFLQGCSDNGKVAQGNKKLNEERIHPTQKPIQLYKWLLKNYAKPGDKILDTHLGSMSIAIAVHEMNKQGMNLTLVGCELDDDYYREAMRRVEQHCRQQSLF